MSLTDRWLAPGSHAWCSEPTCAWTNVAQDCHRHARTHSHLLGHLVHVFEAPAPQGWVLGTLVCGEYAVTPTGPVSCVREREHNGDHAQPPIYWKKEDL